MKRQPHRSRFALATALATLLAWPGGAAKAQSAADLPSGREIVSRYVAAIGGTGAVRKYKSSRAVGTFDVPSQGMSGRLEVLSAAPDRLLLHVTLPGVGEILNGFDGNVGWLIDPMTGPMLLEGRSLAEMKVDADYYGALHDEANYQRIETVERTVFEGTPAYKVHLVRKSGGEDFEFYAVESGLLIGSSGSRTLPMGEVQVTTLLSDYKDFGGLRIPTRSRQRVMGVEQVMTITEVEFDKVDDSAFALPASIKALIK